MLPSSNSSPSGSQFGQLSATSRIILKSQRFNYSSLENHSVSQRKQQKCESVVARTRLHVATKRKILSAVREPDSHVIVKTHCGSRITRKYMAQHRCAFRKIRVNVKKRSGRIVRKHCSHYFFAAHTLPQLERPTTHHKQSIKVNIAPPSSIHHGLCHL